MAADSLVDEIEEQELCQRRERQWSTDWQEHGDMMADNSVRESEEEETRLDARLRTWR